MRKLAISALFFAVAIFLSVYFIQLRLLPIFGAISACICVFSLFLKGNKRVCFFLAFIFMAIGFLWCFLFTTFFIKPYLDLQDESMQITAVITDHPAPRATRGYRVDGRFWHEGNRPVRIRLYYNNETHLQPGDVVSAYATIRRTDINSDGERFDALRARGIFLSAQVSGNLEVTESRGSLRYLPRQFARIVADKIDDIYPDEISHFMKALLVGDRDELYRDTSITASFSASGIIHIISISGMHITFLMGFLALIIRNKRLFAFYSIPILLLFMAMTGFTPAVTRAGVMQIFLICAPIFRRESDSITSLSGALILLLALNPYSIASVGMQLSFSATLGIILFSSKINTSAMELMKTTKIYRRSTSKKVVSFVSSSLATTIGALIFTLPLTAYHFGYVSLIAPLTNLLTIGAVSLAFPLGLISVVFGLISETLGTIIALPVTLLARYVIFVARQLSQIPYSIVYSSNLHIMIWLAYIYVVFTVMPLMKVRARQYIMPICLSIILLLVTILSSHFFLHDNISDSVTVLDVGQGLSVVIASEDHTMLIDCGSLSKRNPGEIAHEFLVYNRRTSIDIMAITHFHTDHINGIEFLLSRMSVSALLIPDPEGCLYAARIIHLASSRGSDIIIVTEVLSFSLGNYTIYVFPPVGFGCENERGITILALGNISALITGDMNKTTERTLLRNFDIPEVDLLVVGHHGSRHSTSIELLEATRPEIAVIPVGRNSFGHPTSDVLDRLKLFSVTTFRTDIHGHVTARPFR